MKWQYLGNFDPENSTENHVALALRSTGHDVVERQENDLGAWRAAADEIGDFDVTLWTRTGWEPMLPRNLQRMLLQAGAKVGVPVVGYHLDRWWGLQREHQVHRELFFRADLVVTADGGHDDEWAGAGVNHLWLPPAVSGAQAAEVGTYREEFDAEIAFVGSWREYHAEWAYRGRLVRWLMETFGDRFRVWEGGVRGQDLADLYASVDVVVGDSCLAGGATRYWSDRIPETVGRGGYLIHPWVDGLEEHFTPGEHLATYELGDFTGLKARIEAALDDNVGRIQVQRQGRAHVLALHTYERRMAQLIDELERRGMIRASVDDLPPRERPLRVTMDLVPVAEQPAAVDVVWLHGQGWWDQGLVARLLNGDEHAPPSGYRFRHHVGGAALAGDEPGAVLVVPGRFMAVDEVQGWLDALAWAVVVVTSDEESTFSWWELRHDRMRLWVQTADRDGDFTPIGEGFAADFPDLLPSRALAPLHDWSFAGQVTHERRQLAAAVMRTMAGGELVETGRFLDDEQGVSRDAYARLLATSKVVPCPSGPETPDTFRCWEALEAGALPILDNRTPRDDRPGYWQRLIGDAPIPRLNDWTDLPALVDEIAEGWPMNAVRAQAWWVAYKRSLGWRLQDDLAAVAGPPRVADLRDLVTVVVTTSPIPSHPDLDVIQDTLKSVWDHLPRAETVIAVDGLRDEQAHLAGAYDEYRRQLVHHCCVEWRNTTPSLLDEHGHQANSVRRALDYVRTPLILFVEHDTPLTGHDLPWDGLCKAVLSGVANSVRFHHEAHVLEPHQYLMLDREPVLVEGVPMLRTVQWSQRPHLASTGFYRELLARHFPPSSRTMIEDKMHSVAQGQPWESTRLWLYAPDGDMKRSLHLDGRQGAEKYEMKFR